VFAVFRELRAYLATKAGMGARRSGLPRLIRSGDLAPRSPEGASGIGQSQSD